MDPIEVITNVDGIGDARAEEVLDVLADEGMAVTDSEAIERDAISYHAEEALDNLVGMHVTASRERSLRDNAADHLTKIQAYLENHE